MPSISALPTPPQRNQDEDTFSTNADAFVAALPTFVEETNEVAADLTEKSSIATAAAEDATAAAEAAEASATSANSGAGAAMWVSGTNYTAGITVWSPLDFRSYRCKVSGVSTTDPSLDDGTVWTSPVTLPGDDAATTTTDTTLVYNSPGALQATPSSPGKYVTLPAANTCRKGSLLFLISNTGVYDYGIKNSAGTKLGWVKPGTTCVVGLTNNSTAAGTWVISNLEKIGVTAVFSSTAVSGGSNVTLFNVVELDSDRVAILFGDTNTYVVVYNKTTLTWGVPSLVRSSLSGGGATMIKSATDQLLVVTCTSTTGLEAVTITTSGTGVTVNSGTKATATLSSNLVEMGRLVAIGSSFVFSYTRTSVLAIRGITISGTTPTIGSEAALSGTATYAPVLQVSTTTLVAISTSTSFVYTKTFTISGTTLTPATEISTAATADGCKVYQLSSTRWALFYLNTTTFAAIVSLSGTTPSYSTVSMGTAASGWNFMEVLSVSSTKLCLFWGAGSANWYANILTDTAGTASAGTILTAGTFGTLSSSISRISVSSNIASFVIRTTSVKQVINIDVSGASPTLSSTHCLPDSSGITFSISNNRFERSGTQAVAGDTLYTLLAASDQAYNLKCASTGFTFGRLMGLETSTSVASLSTAEGESWIWSPSSATAGSLTKVEVAA